MFSFELSEFTDPEKHYHLAQQLLQEISLDQSDFHKKS